ncbi:hypothetical protein ElyMa_002608000 [Elysia marginata]|uniref:Snake toxin/toxin-like domain-containing protein n=1 Tax=Elysia marginata TaxID=1093978 RepID=A0AAV4H2A8_9GAST|nr:hypothetical protein ElyMa_002608000 [Elysia marginata]
MKCVVAVCCLSMLLGIALAQSNSTTPASPTKNPLTTACNNVCLSTCEAVKTVGSLYLAFLGPITGTLNTLCRQVCGLVCVLLT